MCLRYLEHWEALTFVHSNILVGVLVVRKLNGYRLKWFSGFLEYPEDCSVTQHSFKAAGHSTVLGPLESEALEEHDATCPAKPRAVCSSPSEPPYAERC